MVSAPGVNPACGMFNIEHLIAVIVCLLLVVLAIIFTRKFNYKKINTLLKITTFVITILEIIKIAFNIYYEGFSYPNNFIPLHFCSLFIYSLWFSGFGKNKIKKLGESFISGGCIIAGLFFLLMPSTSLQLYPIYHFQCIYSLLFHSLMLYFGIIYFIKGYFKYSFKNYFYYIVFVSIACLLAFILNNILDTNLMFIDNPWGLPINLLHKYAKIRY